jgi:hypothetical protein
LSDIEFKSSELAESFLVQLARAMALSEIKSLNFFLNLIFGKAAQRLATLAIEFDQKVKQCGPAAGVRWILPRFLAGYESRGEEIIPRTGPLLIVANHPSSYDALVISACIDRPDYKIIIGDIPPYRFLPSISRHAIFSPPVTDTLGRMRVLRESIRHLKQGGALLIFPGGNIEPDPAFMSNPGSEFDRWSRSLEIFLRCVPQVEILVTIVSGVISPTAMRHPITRLRKSREDRQRLAYIYQIIRQVLSGKEMFGLKPRVTFGEFVSNTSEQKMMKIEQAARRTLRQHLAWIDAPYQPAVCEFSGRDCLPDL